MSQTLIPCPGERCGVKNHVAGSGEQQNCDRIGQIQRGDMSAMAAIPSATSSVDPDVNVFTTVSAESTHVDSVIHEGRETAYVYDVSLETDSSDEPVVFSYTKGIASVQKSGDPTAQEVLYTLAQERRTLHQTGSARELEMEFGQPDAGYGQQVELIDYPQMYRGLKENNDKLDKLFGENTSALRLAVIAEEGDDYEAENWDEYLGYFEPDPDQVEQAKQDFVVSGYDQISDTALRDDTFEDEDGEPVELISKYDVDDIDEESATKMQEEFERFVEESWDDIEGLDPSDVAHDFWMTRNGHGVGFWDRGLGERGNRLTAAAEKYGEKHLIVGDDGKLYYEG